MTGKEFNNARRAYYIQNPNGEIVRVREGGATTGSSSGGGLGRDLNGSARTTGTTATVASNPTAQKAATPTAGVSISSQKPATTATASATPSTTPYVDAYGNIKEMITSNADAQIASATQRRDDSLKLLNDNYDSWLTGQGQLRDAYLARMANDEAAARKTSNEGYDNTARQNYINYTRMQRQLPSQLNALGIRGGAAESSLIRLGSTYGTNVANNEMARAQALDAIQKQYADAISDYETEYRKAILARDDAKAQQIAQYLDSWNKELADINASRDSALADAYSGALTNDISYKERLADIAREAKQREEDIARENAVREEEYAREDARQKVEDKRYDTEWETNKKNNALQEFKDDHINWSASRLKALIDKMSKKSYETDNKSAKLAYLRGLYDVALKNEKNGK